MGKLIILEGPDGSGKSTLARTLMQRASAAVSGSYLVHHGPYKGLSGMALTRLYEASMVPALFDQGDVVLDRCWLSERPYGEAYREGLVRLAPGQVRDLEEIAWLCRAKVVLCLPPFAVANNNWAARRGTEMLKTSAQFDQVYAWYVEKLALSTSLPVVGYDYTSMKLEDLIDALV